MATITTADISSFILTKASNEDLNDLIEVIKMRRQRLTKMNVRAINVGDKVFFKGRQGVNVEGTVTAVKIKNVIVKTSTGNWRVPANMLTVM